MCASKIVAQMSCAHECLHALHLHAQMNCHECTDELYLHIHRLQAWVLSRDGGNASGNGGKLGGGAIFQGSGGGGVSDEGEGNARTPMRLFASLKSTSTI